MYIDNLSYNLDQETHTATFSIEPRETEDDLIVPETITYNNEVYRVTKIESGAFASWSHIRSIQIPDSITSIGDCAFQSYSNLQSIHIPKSVTHLGTYGVFSECTSLTSITVDPDNPVYDSRENCNAIIETATNTLILGCINTVIPDSVTFIGANAFDGCRQLHSINIPSNITGIGRRAFSNCSNLTTVTLPEGLTYIGESAFSDCDELTNINIPNSVTTIGGYAFSGCQGLTSFYIPENANVEENILYNCQNIKSIVVDPNNKNIDSRDNCNAIICTRTNTLMCICKNSTIPNSITTIATCTFNHLDITEINIPNGVTDIGYENFGYCPNLTTITLPASIEHIAHECFYDCPKLKTIYIPKGTYHKFCDLETDSTYFREYLVEV